MHTARIPPVDAAPAIMTAAFSMHAGQIMFFLEPDANPRARQSFEVLLLFELLSSSDSFRLETPQLHALGIGH